MEIKPDCLEVVATISNTLECNQELFEDSSFKCLLYISKKEFSPAGRILSDFIFV